MPRKPGTPKTGGRQAGTPNKATAEVRSLAQLYGPDAIRKAAELAGLVKDEQGHAIGQAESEQARLAAISIILDRAYGKAPQPIAGDPERPIRSEERIEWVVVRPAN